MKVELQEKLFQKYPALFRQKDLSLKESCMARGIEIEGDGWYWLLDKLCGCIQTCIDRNRLKQIKFEQVKEKLGRLCIYTNYEDKTIDGIIWLASHLSRSICELCGTNKNVTVTKTQPRIKALCVKCRKMYNKLWEKSQEANRRYWKKQDSKLKKVRKPLHS